MLAFSLATWISAEPGLEAMQRQFPALSVNDILIVSPLFRVLSDCQINQLALTLQP
jgi:hypothetical protein